MRRSRRSSGSAPPAPLLLLLLFLLLAVTCLLGVTAPLASAQSDDGDDAPSYVNDEDEAQEARSPSSTPPPSTPPSIDDLAPGAVVSTLRGSPRWKVLPDLFVRRTALVDCEGGQDFRVFVARDAALLSQAIASGSPPAWCGWRRAAARAARGALRGAGGVGGGGSGGGGNPFSGVLALFGPSPSSPSASSPHRSSLPPCEARLPTFGPSAVAVVPRGRGRKGDQRWRSASLAACTVEPTSRLDPALAARLFLGAALFLLARRLAASASFRVSAGAVSFALASALVVLFLVARAVPNKKQLAVAAAAMGSGALTLARLLFGHWVPTLAELASARVLSVYAGCSLAAGAAVAFWFDDPGAAKAHAILAAALRLAGLALVAGGVSSPVVGFALAGVLALVGFAGPRRVAGPLAELMERRRRRAEAEEERRRRRATTATTTENAGGSSPPRRQVSPLLFQQQEQRSPEAALRQRLRSASVSTAAFESPERSAFFPLASSSPQRTSRGGGGEQEAGGGRSSPSRSPTGPLLFRRPASPPAPLLFASAAAVPLPSAAHEEEEEAEAEEGGREVEESPGGRRRTTTTSEFRPSQQNQQESGWQREEPHRPSAAPPPPPPPRALATTSAATSTPARSSLQQRQQSQSRSGSLPLPARSPLVDRGLLLNEATGKTIKIGAATYNRLVLEGYTVDEGRGTLSPPVRARGGNGGGGGGGAGAGSNLRPRTRNS